MGASLSDLAKRLGADQLATGGAIPPRYRLDAFRAHRGSHLPEDGVPPAAVAWPRSTEDVVSIVRFAADAGLAIVPWGGGTGLMGGARPSSDSVVVDMRRMRRVRSIDVAARTATAEAGVVLEALDRRLRKRRLMLGHDPWSRPRATVGGAIGTNGIGYGAYLRGTMGDQVLGLEAVLSDGTVVQTRRAARSTTGLDLKRLFIGTEGTLGVVTAATLRVFPIPEREEIHAFSLRDFSTGFGCLARVYDSGLTPSVMDFEETFPAPALPWRSEEGPPVLYLGFAGSPEVVGASWRVAHRHLRQAASRPLPDREAREYWRTRHDIIYAHDEVSPGVTRADLFLKDVIFDYVHAALPRSKVLPYRRAALAILRRHGTKPIGFGVWTQPELVSLEVVRPVGEEYVHGVGAKLAHLVPEELGVGLAVARKVKRALDPAGTLNPGKAGL